MGRRFDHDDDGNILLSAAGETSIIDDDEATRQRLEVRLGTPLGSWFLDPTVGVPYFQVILGSKENPTAFNSIFMEAILETDGVSRLKAPIQYSFNDQTRVLSMSFTAIASSGAEIDMTLPGLPEAI